MMDEKSAKELESKYYADKKSVSAEDLFKLSNYYYYKRENLSEKDRKPLPKRLQKTPSSSMRAVHLASLAYKKGARERDYLEYYKKLLLKYKYRLSHNNFLIKVLVELRKLDGIEEPKIVNKARGVGAVEGGTLYFRDMSYDAELISEIDANPYEFDKVFDKFLETGKCITLGTGGDGWMGLQIREVDGNMPLLTDKEYKISPVSSEEYVIAVATGKLIFSDIGLSGVTMEVIPGNYLCRIYCIDIHDKFFGYYAVICKTDKEAVNKNAHADSLEPGS